MCFRTNYIETENKYYTTNSILVITIFAHECLNYEKSARRIESRDTEVINQLHTPFMQCCHLSFISPKEVRAVQPLTKRFKFLNKLRPELVVT